jgi:hypothetical protein
VATTEITIQQTQGQIAYRSPDVKLELDPRLQQWLGRLATVVLASPANFSSDANDGLPERQRQLPSRFRHTSTAVSAPSRM